MTMSFTGVVHRDQNGILWFDDKPVRGPLDMPTGRAWRKTLWYAPQGISSSDWAKVMRPGDVAFGPRPGQVLGVSFKLPGKTKMQVWSASSWGVSTRDPNRCYKRLQDVRAQAVACGLKLKNSIAASALQLYMDRFDGRAGHPSMRQLAPRWRGLAHAAMHGGPISVLSGGAPYAVQIDVEQAYLHALTQPVPALGIEGGRRVGGWATHRDPKWHNVRTKVGFVDATVRIHGDLRDPAGLPPLPVHTSAGAIFPTGRARGCWTIAQVREAEERGEVEVEKVHQFSYTLETRPLFAELAEVFASFPQPLSKRCYTRFWGKLGSRGGFQGTVSDEPRDGEVPAGGLWWKYDGVELESHKAARTYRPDLASFVSAHNHRSIFKTLRQLQPGSVVATHVDAIWTTDLVGSARICAARPGRGGWRPKRSGPLRFYGIGCYQHGGRLAASGYSEAALGKLTTESIERWIKGDGETHRRLLLQSREWAGDPAETREATSRPLQVDLDTDRSPIEGPDVYDRAWSSSGWYRPSTSAEPGDPVSTSPPHQRAAGA